MLFNTKRMQTANFTLWEILQTTDSLSSTTKLQEKNEIWVRNWWIERKLKDMIRWDQISCSVVSDSLWPHESQHARHPCPSPTPGVHSDSRPLSQWCHPAISFSVIPFSSCSQSLPVSESFPMSQLFGWGGQSTGVSALASFLPKKSQGWWFSFRMDWLDLLAVQGTLKNLLQHQLLQKHQFFGAQPSSQSDSHIHTWPQEKP